MCVWLYVCVWECVLVCECMSVCECMCVWVCVSVSVCMCVSVWMYECVSVCVSVCEYECVYVCQCVNVWVCVWVYVCVSVCFSMWEYVSVCLYMWICECVSMNVRECVYECVCVCVCVCVFPSAPATVEVNSIVLSPISFLNFLHFSCVLYSRTLPRCPLNPPFPVLRCTLTFRASWGMYSLTTLSRDPALWVWIKSVCKFLLLPWTQMACQGPQSARPMGMTMSSWGQAQYGKILFWSIYGCYRWLTSAKARVCRNYQLWLPPPRCVCVTLRLSFLPLRLANPAASLFNCGQ